MLVIVSVSHFDGNAVAIHVARPQHDSNARQEYRSEKEIYAVLSDFGISEEAIASQLRLLSKTSVNEPLKFPPMDVPLHKLLSRGFRL
jgi:hypothetical protein